MLRLGGIPRSYKMEKVSFQIFNSDLFVFSKWVTLLTCMSFVTVDEEAFDELYCIAFEMMDAQWLAMNASYMDFNVQSLPLSQSHGK